MVENNVLPYAPKTLESILRVGEHNHGRGEKPQGRKAIQFCVRVSHCDLILSADRSKISLVLRRRRTLREANLRSSALEPTILVKNSNF